MAEKGEVGMVKMKKLVAIALVVLCLCGCTGGNLGGDDSPEEVVSNVLDAYMDADIEEIVEMLPRAIAEPYLKINQEKIDGMNESIEKELEGLETDYEIGKKTKMSEGEIVRYESRLTSAAQRYVKEAGLGNPAMIKIDITEAYTVEAILENGRNKSKAEFPVGKIGEKWYLLYDSPNM